MTIACCADLVIVGVSGLLLSGRARQDRVHATVDDRKDAYR